MLWVTHNRFLYVRRSRRWYSLLFQVDRTGQNNSSSVRVSFFHFFTKCMNDTSFIKPNTRFIKPPPRFIKPTPRFIKPTPRFIKPTPHFITPTPRFFLHSLLELELEPKGKLLTLHAHGLTTLHAHDHSSCHFWLKGEPRTDEPSRCNEATIRFRHQEA